MTATTQLGHVLRLSAAARGRQIASIARRHVAVSACATGVCLLMVAGCGSAAAPVAGSGGHSHGTGPAGIAGTSASPQPLGSPPAQGMPCVSASGSGACASPAPASATPQVSLDVTVYAANYPVNRTTPAQYTLYCEPAGGTVPDPAAACTQLLADTDLFAPKPVGVVCPMIIADSARFAISGTYLGRPVNEVIADGGCDLQRWNELRQIFPTPSSGLQQVAG